MTTAAIEFRGLTKDYGAAKALDNVDLEVHSGEIFGFLGPNGAGKSTAIRCLLDLIRPTSGETFLLGLNSRKDSVAVRERCGYLPGELRLYDDLTGRDVISYFSSLRGGVNIALARDLCDRLGLIAGKVVRSYSKGNKQKLGLVLALMHRPPVLVLDEPTSGLDPLVQEEVGVILKERAADGAAVFLSSHVLSEVESLCDRVGFIRGGRIVALEEVAGLKGRSLHLIEVTFAQPPPAGAFDLPGVVETSRQGARVVLEVRDAIDSAVKAIAPFEVVDLRTKQPSLEEVFLAYYHEEGSR